MSFPVSPTNGQTAVVNNTTYVYDSMVGTWTVSPNSTINNLTLSGSTISTSASTGTLVVGGGMGVSGNIYLTGNLVTNTGITTQSNIVVGSGGQLIGYVNGAIGANGANSGTFTTTTTSGNATVSGNVVLSDSTAFNTAASLGPRNRVINGDMRIDQRNAGVAFTVPNASGYGSCDRWASIAGAVSVWTLQQVSTGNQDFPYALRSQRANGSSSTSANYVGQVIETINCQDLAGQTVTLSYYATAGANFSGASSAIIVEIWTGTGTNQGWNSLGSATWTGQTLVYSQNVVITTTRTKYTATATIGAGVNEIAVRFNYSGVGTAGANDWFQVTGVQLEQGTIATPFERRQYGQELALCQRYYQMSYDLGTAPGTSTTVGLYAFGVALNGSTPGPGSIPFRVSMRATPSIAYWDGAGNSTKLSTGSPPSQTNNISPTGAPSQLGTNGFAHPGQVATGNITNWLHYAASAEL